MMLLVDEPGTSGCSSTTCAGRSTRVELRRQDGHAVRRHQRAGWGVQRPVAGTRARLSELRVPSAVRPARARRASASSTPGPTRATRRRRPTSSPAAATHTHDTVLLEWTAKNPGAATYDGGAPRELMRFEQPFAEPQRRPHRVQSARAPGDADFGLLYIGVADGGSGGDPLEPRAEPELGVRQDPAHRSARHEQRERQVRHSRRAIRSSNDDKTRARSARSTRTACATRSASSGIRRTARMFMADIGQNIVEEISLVTPGANLGWNVWEGSFRFIGRGGVEHRQAAQRSEGHVSDRRVRSDRSAAADASAVTAARLPRDAIPQLSNMLMFGDNPSGEIFYVRRRQAAQAAGRTRSAASCSNDGSGEPKTLLQIIKEKNTAQGKKPASRADLRFGQGPRADVPAEQGGWRGEGAGAIATVRASRFSLLGSCSSSVLGSGVRGSGFVSRGIQSPYAEAHSGGVGGDWSRPGGAGRAAGACAPARHAARRPGHLRQLDARAERQPDRRTEVPGRADEGPQRSLRAGVPAGRRHAGHRARGPPAHRAQRRARSAADRRHARRCSIAI